MTRGRPKRSQKLHDFFKVSLRFPPYPLFQRCEVPLPRLRGCRRGRKIPAAGTASIKCEAEIQEEDFFSGNGKQIGRKDASAEMGSRSPEGKTLLRKWEAEV